MKKTLLLLFAVLSLATSTASFAQNGSWEIQFGLGSGMSAHSKGRAEILYRSEDEDSPSPNAPTILPTIMFSAGYNLKNAPVGIFLDLGWDHAWSRLKGGPSLLREQESRYHVMPNLKLYYIRRESFRMYATLGVDMNYRRFEETYAGTICSNQQFNIGYQVAPVGFSFGDRWCFSFDLGYGTLYSLARINVGYRF